MAAVALLGCAGSPAASEQPGEPDFSCALAHPAKMFDSLTALPGDIRTFVTAKFGPMAERGGDFNATDVIVKPAPSRRFIRAGKSGDTWFLWYEQGGIALEADHRVQERAGRDAKPRELARQSLRRDR